MPGSSISRGLAESSLGTTTWEKHDPRSGCRVIARSARTAPMVVAPFGKSPNVPDERRAGDVELQALYLSRVRSIRLLCFLVAPLVIAPNKEPILLLGEIAIVDRLDQGVNKAAGITIGHCRTDLKRSSDRLAVSFMDKALQCRPERRLLFFGK